SRMRAGGMRCSPERGDRPRRENDRSRSPRFQHALHRTLSLNRHRIVQEMVVTNLQPVPAQRTMEEQRREFASRRGLAMPLAGLVAWGVVGMAGIFLPPGPEVWVLFGATGSILLLGICVSRFTGENLLDKQRPKNVFDSLFLHTVAMAVLVYAIAIPFFQADYTSLPLSVGILSGLMWLPLSWIIGHWVGTFHTLARPALITAVWYVFPLSRFIVVPAVIVAVYAVTIIVLEVRWRRSSRV